MDSIYYNVYREDLIGSIDELIYRRNCIMQKRDYRVTQRDSGSQIIQAATPQEAIAKSYNVGMIFIKKADKETATYCVECLGGTRRSIKYYTIATATKATESELEEENISLIGKWFDVEVSNWYDAHIADGDEDDPDYLFMDDYTSDVTRVSQDTLLFMGECYGHYENPDETRDFTFGIEDMKESLKDCGIKVGEHVTLKKTKDGIAVTLKAITLKDFMMMTR